MTEREHLIVDALIDLVHEARRVEENWEQGNLAAAVNGLLACANEAEDVLMSIGIEVPVEEEDDE